ncbi:MAG TPA: LCP family protein [Micromonosporaceae bacterium]|nr:LCP family protein [Micromonosporaceae bacterium]
MYEPSNVNGMTPGRSGTGKPQRRRLAWAAAVVAVVALLLTGGLVVNRLSRSSDAPPQAASTASPSPAVTPSASAKPSAKPTQQPGAGLTGPLNMLLVGVDTRVAKAGWEPHADAVMVMHITKNLDQAYLFSLPRDLLVQVPAFPPARFGGQYTKLTHAMSYGSRVPGRRLSPSTAQGFRLLSTTVSRYTGIAKFDAGAVLTFGGMYGLVGMLGGIDLYVDQRVASIHRRPDGSQRSLGNGPGGFVGPQMVYQPGRRHLVGWQALDYARQRYIPGGDYARQRHQQQLIKAIVQAVLSKNLARDPVRLERVVRALGKSLTFQGGGRRVVDFAFALSRLRPQAIRLVALPGDSVVGGSGYRGERLEPVGRQFIAALRAGRAAAFLAEHPTLVKG